ncbi:hypothetical protein BG57_17840 [Caballeronia grimmiae]|uniref:Uncharacterized protein n=1 Tax=Caballeronia grimmiae TaxID=1071679 RepID=A0A069NMC4_9BURK|nr:hypothetical protein BG57_17840 [Caballeronia grimmiae]
MSASGAVKIEHKLSLVAVGIKCAQETVAHQKRALCDGQSARLDAIELSLSVTLAGAKASIQLFQSARAALRPMDAAEQRLIEELVDSGVVPKINART